MQMEDRHQANPSALKYSHVEMRLEFIRGHFYRVDPTPAHISSQNQKKNFEIIFYIKKINPVFRTMLFIKL